MGYVDHLAIHLAFSLLAGITMMDPSICYIKTDYFDCWYKYTASQTTCDSDLGCAFEYGTFGNMCFADHSNQNHKNLKQIVEGDVLTLISNGKRTSYKCVHIQTMKVDDQGHIRDSEGLYMGDAWTPCIVLYTCQGKDRLVTIWKEI